MSEASAWLASFFPCPTRLVSRFGGGDDFVNRDRPLDDVVEEIAGRTGDGDGVLIADDTWSIAGYRLRDA